MNSVIVRSLAMFCLIAGLGSICLMAQGPIQVTIPFDFNVDAKSFPAGDYLVRPDLSHMVLAIRSADGNSAAMTLTQPIQANTPSGGTRLVFNRYGNQYFLSQVWENGSQGRELHKSSKERELIAQSKSTKSIALVASSRE